MKIYAQEIEDGLVEALTEQNTVAYLSPAIETSRFNLSEKSIASILQASKAATSNPDQIDLFYLSSILVSTGWNKNDDVFSPADTWAARKTPEDKQFNFMHNEKDIIGHITGCYAVNFNGDMIPDDIETAPEEFNIVTSSVIYKSWSDLEQKVRIQKIIEEIQEGSKWFVSMECLFPEFDYALRNSMGETKIIKRQEASAFLTKHLRSYGGSGEYEGYQVGRVLRNLSFSGKGLVSKPANPKSIILNSDPVSTEPKEKDMSVQAKADDQLQAELAEAKVMNEKMKKEQEDAKAKIVAFESMLVEKDQTIASYQEQIKDLQSTLAEVKSSLEQLAQAKKDMEDQFMEMKKKSKMEKRKASLTEAGVEETDLDATLASFDSMADEAFDHVVALMKKKAKKMEQYKEEASTEDSDSESVAKDTLDAAQPQQDSVESTLASLNEDASDEEESEQLRATASTWFASFLNTTKKTN
jgi:hypothetical protein